MRKKIKKQRKPTKKQLVDNKIKHLEGEVDRLTKLSAMYNSRIEMLTRERNDMRSLMRHGYVNKIDVEAVDSKLQSIGSLLDEVSKRFDEVRRPIRVEIPVPEKDEEE